MKAVILAAGLGTRLRPLTDHRPKGMLPLAGRPLLSYTLDLLRRHGVFEAYINLHWQPEAIQQYFGQGEREGVRLHYLLEEELSGTAGPLRKLRQHLQEEPFLVLNGDNLTNLDLTELVNYHRRAGGVLTVALHAEEAEDLPAKSVVEVLPDGRISRFLEKPDAASLFSRWSSAGIYVVEPSVIDLIPEGAAYDFGHDLIPRLLADGLPVYGYQADFYLLDIGTPEAYARAQADLEASKVL